MADTKDITTIIDGELVLKATEVSGTRKAAVSASDRLKYVTTIVNTEDGDELALKVTGIGGGGGSSFDPTKVEGYDATKQQVLLNDLGTMRYKSPVLRSAYCGFNSSAAVFATTNMPSSYTTAKLIMNFSISRATNSGQNIIHTGNNAQFGFGPDGNFGSYNGSSAGVTQTGYVLPTGEHRLWVQAIVDGTTDTLSLYCIQDNNGVYSRATLPSDLSDWIFVDTNTSFSWKGQSFQFGNSPDYSYAPLNMTLFDGVLTFDDVTFLDMNEPSTYRIQNLTKMLYTAFI